MSEVRSIFGSYRQEGLHDAYMRLGYDGSNDSLFRALAVLVNRVADLEERLEAYEKAQHEGPEDADGQPTGEG